MYSIGSLNVIIDAKYNIGLNGLFYSNLLKDDHY